MAILRVKDKDGNWQEIPSLIGAKGDKGDKGDKGERGERGPAGAKGDRGEGLDIVRTYPSVAAMNEGYATDNVPIGKCVLINTGDVEDVENSRLYLKTETEYMYLNDLSGSQGIKGESGDTPFIGENGNWWIGNTDTGTKATGKDGKDGENGKDGLVGRDGQNGLDGKDGLTPYIGENGNWWIGDEDTGTVANASIEREFQSISSIDKIYEDVTDLYDLLEPENGTRYVAKTNGDLPYVIYSWNSTTREWEKIAEVTKNCIYNVLDKDFFDNVLYKFSPDEKRFIYLQVEAQINLSNVDDIYFGIDELIKAVKEDPQLPDAERKFKSLQNGDNRIVATPYKAVLSNGSEELRGKEPLYVYTYEAKTNTWIKNLQLNNHTIYMCNSASKKHRTPAYALYRCRPNYMDFKVLHDAYGDTGSKYYTTNIYRYVPETDSHLASHLGLFHKWNDSNVIGEHIPLRQKDGAMTCAVPKITENGVEKYNEAPNYAANVKYVQDKLADYPKLDATSKIPSNYLPSFVDSVMEYLNITAFPAKGESAKIYVAKDTNKTYRWSGSTYVEISASLALGETATTAYPGNKGKSAYDHSLKTSGNPHNVTLSDLGVSASKGELNFVKGVKINIQTQIDEKANKADIAKTASYGSATGDISFYKISDFGNWGGGTWYLKNFSMLITSRAGETIWVSVAADDSNTNARAFRLMNTHTKIAGVYYKESDNALYVKAAGWCNNINAHILSNIYGDYVPTITSVSAIPEGSTQIPIIEFGVASGKTVIGGASAALEMSGSGDRPTYNGNGIALSSDIPSTTKTLQFTLEDNSTKSYTVYVKEVK